MFFLHNKSLDSEAEQDTGRSKLLPVCKFCRTQWLRTNTKVSELYYIHPLQNHGHLHSTYQLQIDCIAWRQLISPLSYIAINNNNTFYSPPITHVYRLLIIQFQEHSSNSTSMKNDNAEAWKRCLEFQFHLDCAITSGQLLVGAGSGWLGETDFAFSLCMNMDWLLESGSRAGIILPRWTIKTPSVGLAKQRVLLHPLLLSLRQVGAQSNLYTHRNVGFPEDFQAHLSDDFGSCLDSERKQNRRPRIFEWLTCAGLCWHGARPSRRCSDQCFPLRDETLSGWYFSVWISF